MSKKTLYKIIFSNQGKVYEVYSRSIAQSEMFGFIEFEELVFGENSGVLVDPSEERIKAEFHSVKRSYVPMHSVFRIDEVLQEGTSKIRELNSSNNSTGNVVSPFPQQVYSKSDGDKQ